MNIVVLLTILLPYSTHLYPRSEIVEQIKSDGCEDNWTVFESKCFKFMSRRAETFLQAVELCRSEESSLLMIKNERIQNFTTTLAIPESYYRHDHHHEDINTPVIIWLGIKPVGEDRIGRFRQWYGTFANTLRKYWIDGTPVVQTNFVSNDCDHHFGYRLMDNSYYLWFYFFDRIKNKTIQCGQGHVNGHEFEPCGWTVNHSDTESDVEYGVICEKDPIVTESTVTESNATDSNVTNPIVISSSLLINPSTLLILVQPFLIIVTS